MSTVPDTSVKPTVVITPDSRFATSFLSTKYRDKAVAGEALMDKSTGELFIKRKSDGRLISFHQNKKMLNDLAIEFRFLLTNNPLFIYPSTSDTSYYASVNYDLVAINNESYYNIITDNVIIPGTPNEINKLSFMISKDSNGFFCNNTTRDIDKPVIEFLTNQYNLLFKNYSGDNEIYLQEKNKFEDVTWEYNNAILTYDIAVYKDGETYLYTRLTENIRINEDSCVLLPEAIYDDLGSFDYAEVTVKSITYDKIHFMFNHKDEFGVIFTESLNKLLYNDTKIEVAEFNITHFVDGVDSVELHGNENIIAFVDVQHLRQFMFSLEKSQSSAVIISDTKPNHACTWFKPLT
jgi:hypothetical protein